MISLPKTEHRGRRSRGHHSVLTHQLCVWFISGFSSVWFVLLQSYKTNKYVCGIFGPVCFAYCVSIPERFIEFENLHSKVIGKRRPDELCILNIELAPRKVQNGVSIQSTVHTMSGVKRPLDLKSLWTAFWKIDCYRFALKGLHVSSTWLLKG